MKPELAPAPSPELIRKASRLASVRLRDGSYQVAGDTATRTVHVRSSPAGDREYFCDCPSAQTASRWCSHILHIHLRASAPSARAHHQKAG